MAATGGVAAPGQALVAIVAVDGLVDAALTAGVAGACIVVIAVYVGGSAGAGGVVAVGVLASVSGGALDRGLDTGSVVADRGDAWSAGCAGDA